MATAEVYRPPEFIDRDRPAFEFGLSLPRYLQTNQRIETWGIVDFDGNPITADSTLTKMGIESRRVAGFGESTREMGKKAAQKLVQQGEGLDSVIFTSSIPVGYNQADRLVSDLGITADYTIEVGVACSGFAKALKLVYEQPDVYGNDILIDSSEIYSRYCADLRKLTASADRSQAQLIFSDGAYATRINLKKLELLSTAELHILSDDILMPEGIPHDEGNYHAIEIPKSTDYFRQNGRAVMRNIAKYGPRIVDEIRERANLRPDQIKLVVSHQPTMPALQILSEKSPGYTFLRDYRKGNFSSASIPKALMSSMSGNAHEAFKDGQPVQGNFQVEPGDVAILFGFGAGFELVGEAVRIHK